MTGEIFGRYRIERELGRGGMGEVHEAYDTRNERTVALKRLHPWLAADPEFRARFRRESRAAASLGSPHVVPIHDFGDVDGRLYIDMRLVQGRDLAELIAEEGPLDTDLVATIVDQVADALDSAHATGLVHRDIKPSNVLVTGRPDRRFAYLTDFGIARSTDGTALTSAGAVIGTLAYMAPELFADGRAEPAADVYALACLAHEALCGDPPFPVRGAPALVHAHLHTPPPRASAVRCVLPVAVDDVLVGGMAKDPAARPGTATELAQALRAALTPAPPVRIAEHPSPTGSAPTVEDGPTAVHDSAGRPATRRLSRRPAARRTRLLLLAGAAVLLAAIVTAAALLWPTPDEVSTPSTASTATPSPTRVVPNAPTDLEELRQAFPVTRTADCGLVDDPTSGQPTQAAALFCRVPSEGMMVFLDRWKTDSDARDSFQDYQNQVDPWTGSDGAQWGLRTTGTGSNGNPFAMGWYTDTPYTIFVEAPTTRAAQKGVDKFAGLPPTRLPG